MSFSLNREIEFNGITYTVIEMLEKDLLLAVPKSDLVKGVFPLTPVILKDEWAIDQVGNMNKKG